MSFRAPTLGELPPPPPGKSGWPWTNAVETLPVVVPDETLFPRVTIVTPSYNQAQFIEETIRSVLLQGYGNLEYIIIDGGSTDGSVQIIRKYAPWLADWVSEPDEGQADAINKGLKRGHGEIVTWLNSDDYYLPGTLNAVTSRFATDPGLGLVFGDIQVLDDRGKLSDAIGYAVPPAEMLASLEIPYQPSSFFRRAVLARENALDASLRYVMDVDILLKVMANAEYSHTPSSLAVFRIHAESKTHLAEIGFARELLWLRERVERDLALYPGLARVGAPKTRQNFYRLAAKHFYQGARFRESLDCIARACQADPKMTLAILRDEGIGWLAKLILPIEHYRSLSYRLRNVPQKAAGQD